MSQPRHEDPNEAAVAPWLAHNALWSPSTASSSPAVTPAHPITQPEEHPAETTAPITATATALSTSTPIAIEASVLHAAGPISSASQNTSMTFPPHIEKKKIEDQEETAGAGTVRGNTEDISFTGTEEEGEKRRTPLLTSPSSGRAKDALSPSGTALCAEAVILANEEKESRSADPIARDAQVCNALASSSPQDKHAGSDGFVAIDTQIDKEQQQHSYPCEVAPRAKQDAALFDHFCEQCVDSKEKGEGEGEHLSSPVPPPNESNSMQADGVASATVDGTAVSACHIKGSDVPSSELPDTAHGAERLASTTTADSAPNELENEAEHKSPARSQLHVKLPMETVNADEEAASDLTRSPLSNAGTPAQRESSAPRPPQSSKHATPTTSPTATGKAEAPTWVSCHHSDPPARYRDTPAYYCTYCSYTVCVACFFHLSSPSSPAEQPATLSEGSSSQQQQQQQQCTDEMEARSVKSEELLAGQHDAHTAQRAPVGMDWLDHVLTSSTSAVHSHGSAITAAGKITATDSQQQQQQQQQQRTHRSLFTLAASATTATDVAKPAPPLCHLCRRGHLLREEALLHEWCCEGPAPEDRLHRGHHLIYATHNLQKYHFMRAQRETRLASTAPLQAQVLSVDAANLEGDVACFSSRYFDRHNPNASLALQQREVLRKQTRRGTVQRDPMPSSSPSSMGFTGAPAAAPPQRATRRSAADVAQGALSGGGDSHRQAARSRRRDRSVGASTWMHSACEEGGSFVFSVRNPRLEVQLVWCAVNRQAREETPAYARVENMTAGVSSSSSGGWGLQALGTTSSVTPLLLWRCPPSLPGLPARPYRLTIPYGLYAYANVHALTLYVASDIFRKATTQLVGIAGEGNGEDNGVGQHLSSMKIAPATTLRPLLTVSVLHHVATTPRPLSFKPPGLVSAATQNTQHDIRTSQPQKRTRGDAMGESGVAPLAERATPPTNSARTEKSETASNEDASSHLRWPEGLSSYELALCVDHLLHGRSIAVYGIASKFFFLQHVASSAQLKHFHVLTVDASLGRAGTQHIPDPHNPTTATNSAAAAPSSSSSSSSSVVRQLISVGHVLMKRVSDATVLTAEMRAHMTAGAIAAAAGTSSRLGKTLLKGETRPALRHAKKLVFDQGSDDGEAATLLPVTRAMLPSDMGRSPALARDVTAAMSRAKDVVDVDSPSSTSSSSSSSRWAKKNTDGACGTTQNGHFTRAAREVLLDSSRTPTHATQQGGRPPFSSFSPSPLASAVSPVSARSPQARLRLLSGGHTPVSQRLRSTRNIDGTGEDGDKVSRSALTQLEQSSSSLQPSPSPIPAFFEVLQRTVSGEEGPPSSSHDAEHQHAREGRGEAADGASAVHGQGASARGVVCEELPEYFGDLNSLRLPPHQRGEKGRTEAAARTPTPAGALGAAAALPPVEWNWMPPHVVYASDSVRRLVLQSLRRQHAGRRCVQWASQPSTTAAAQLKEQMQVAPSGPPVSPARLPLLLPDAHRTRPGWQPPVLLVVHNVDLLDAEEANVLLQLCAPFAFPNPHLQLLLSFDDPLWPLGAVAASLARMGVCAVQLRSLLLPRVHETHRLSSVQLLTEFEAAAAASSAGSGGGRGGGRKAALGNSLMSGGVGAGGTGSAHLLQDTLRRVLFSLPPAFNGLLRILLDVQDEVGDGVFVSLFTVTERFERGGMMVSQGRLKALLRELTSNRIARYDAAEHALMVPQVGRLRKVLEEVTAQRESGGGDGVGGAPS